jgi:hypothetical protein
VPGHYQVVRLIRAVESGCVADAEVDLLGCLFGFSAGSIDHLWRQIDPRHGMAQFSEPEGEEASSASHVQNASRPWTCETRKQIEPRKTLLVANQTVTDLVVERARLAIPMMPYDFGDSDVTSAHTNSAAV